MKTIIIVFMLMTVITYAGHDERPSDYYYYMGQRQVNSKYLKKQKIGDNDIYVRPATRTTFRYENGKLVRYYFDNFRNGYNGSRSPSRRRCR